SMPQPAGHSGQMLGFHTARPPERSSSGTNRTMECSGLPQLTRVAVAPEAAVIFRKSRRSIFSPKVKYDWLRSEVTRNANDRRIFSPVTRHAKPHGMIHNGAGHRHRAHIAVTGDALNGSCNMRSMVKPHVRFIVPSIDALPGNVL